MKLKHFISAVGLGLGLTLILLVGMANADGPDQRKRRHLSSPTPSPLSATWTAAFTTPCMANLSPPLGAAAGPSLRETNLTPGGDIFEVNPDAQGNLWLSDSTAGQVWQFNRGTLAFTIYNGLRDPADARRDNSNNVWATDVNNGNGLLGRINLAASMVTTWTLPGAIGPLGVAIDAGGQVWVVDDVAPYIYRFDLDSTQVCSYTVPDDGGGDYIIYNASDLWIGDYYNSRLVKLDPGANQFTYWQLPFGSDPEGLAVDGSGDVWWADLAALGRLEPAANRVTTYPLPVGHIANMLAIGGGSIWYTEEASRTFGVVNPAVAGGMTSVVTSATVAVTPSCAVLGPGVTIRPLICSGVAVFTPGVFTPTVNSGGWRAYQLPEPSLLWGIANAGGVWIGDLGRDKLVWFSYPLYLPIVFK
jgi:streptogramin lyase